MSGKGEAERIVAELSVLTRKLLGEIAGDGAALPESVPLRVELRVPISADPADAGGVLLAAVRDAVLAASAVPDVYRDGVVHCFRCSASDCGHGAPPRPAAVFSGFAPTGQPEWNDFASELVALRDDRASLLYEARPQLVVLQRSGRDQKARLLGAFGRSSKSWDLLGQLSVGYLRTSGGPLALSLLVVESRGADGRVRIALSVVGKTPDERRPSEWLESSGERRIAEAVVAARRAFRELEEEHARIGRPGAGRGDSSVLGKVPRILSALRRDLEQRDRQGGRRTVHAEERRRDHRPTPAAARDLREATAESFYEDEKRGTLVVLGPKGRAHVFAPDGRHVTSLVLTGDELTRRIERERWRPLAKERADRLRSSVGESDHQDEETSKSGPTPRS